MATTEAATSHDERGASGGLVYDGFISYSHAADDLLAFSRQIAREDFATIRHIVKEIAPDQLYLGCRFAWSNRQAVLVGAEYCDVVSYNLYRRSVAESGHDT